MGPVHSWGGRSLVGVAALVAMVATIGGFVSIPTASTGTAYSPSGPALPAAHAPVLAAPSAPPVNAGRSLPVSPSTATNAPSVATPVLREGASSAPLAARPFPAVPGLNLSVPYGTVGTSVTLSGHNFRGSATITDLATATWSPGGAVLCSGAIDATTGNFSCTFVVPESTAAAHTINVTAPAAQSASTPFSVNASLSESPSSGTSVPGANDMVTLTTMGLAGNSPTTWTWSPGSLQLCANNASALGTAVCVFNVPTGASYSAIGNHSIKSSDSAGHSATVNFTIVPTVSVQFTSTTSLYTPLNLSLAWTITAGAPINSTSTSMWLLVEDLGSSACPFVRGSASVGPPCQVLNLSLSYLITSGTTSYSFVLNQSTMTSQFYNKGNLPFSTEYSVSVFVRLATGPYSGGTAKGASEISGVTLQSYLRVYQPQAVLLSPSTGLGNPTGNISVTVSYGGDFVTGATVSIVSQKTQSLVYAGSVAVAGIGPHIGTAPQSWHPTIAGAYTVTVNLSGPEDTTLITFDVNVVPAGTTVYVNSTQFTNQSLLHGLNAAVTGSLLLVVGTLIGLVVAFLIGRMVWAKPSESPPTPWSSDKSAKKGTNECDICHQSFGTEAELKEHAAKVHGSSSKAP